MEMQASIKEEPEERNGGPGTAQFARLVTLGSPGLSSWLLYP